MLSNIQLISDRENKLTLVRVHRGEQAIMENSARETETTYDIA